MAVELFKIKLYCPGFQTYYWRIPNLISYFLVSSQINRSLDREAKKSVHFPSPEPVKPPWGKQSTLPFSSNRVLGMSQHLDER
jgi:hypothetical protein